MYNLDVKNLLQKDFPCVLEFMTLQIMSQHIHIASNFNVTILDIIEKDKTVHYTKITSHMKNYKHLYRDNFLKLSKDIINNS